MASQPEPVTIDVKINDAALAELRALAERCERAAERTEVAASLRLPLRPAVQPPQAEKTAGVAPESTYTSAAYWRSIADKRGDRAYRLESRIAELERACEAKDRELADRNAIAEELTSTRAKLSQTIFERDELGLAKGHLEYALKQARGGYPELNGRLTRVIAQGDELRKEVATLKAALEIERTHLSLLRKSLERDSAEHFATRIALRDTLRAAAAYAREAALLTGDVWNQKFKERANEDAAQFDAARAALGLDTIDMPPAAGETATQQPAPAPARRRRFLAGDRVRPAAQEIVYSAVLDEDDSGSVAIQIGSGKYLNVGAAALELIEPTTPAKRNSEFAFHFHIWHLNIEPGSMDSVPEFVRVAAEQLMRDPFGTEYGSVLADAKTGGAK